PAERIVLVPWDQQREMLAGETIEIEIVHADAADEPVGLGEEILDGQLGDEGVDVEIVGELVLEIESRRVVDRLDEIANRHIEIRDRFGLMRLRAEPRDVPAEIRSWIFEPVVLAVLVVEL